MVEEGTIFGRIQETVSIEHRLLIPMNKSGKVVSIKPNGSYKIKDIVLVVQDKKWDQS